MKAFLIIFSAGLLGVLFLFVATRYDTGAEASIPKIEVTKHTLDNGLEVLLVEDHRLPRVAVNLWYHVGPVNEEPGRTGFAHLFEHMMFQKSKHVPEDSFFRLLEAAGASDMNGTTDFDRTNYFETVPANQLELALWLESDRMGYLLDDLTAESFKNQQDVVRNERRQSIENQPFGMVQEGLFHTLYPKEHPYYASVIGSHQDIQAAQLEDVKTFFKQYYSPNNASIAIVGDIKKPETLELVRKYFGTFKKGSDIPPVQVTTPPITSERRLVVKDRVELPRLYMAWITPPIYKDGDAEAGIAADILGGDKVSRLYKSLVYEKQIAQKVSASRYPLTLGSFFSIEATAAPGHTLEEIEKEIDVELEAMRTRVPDLVEMDGAKRSIETGILLSLEYNGGFDGIADRINMYNHHVKNPDYLTTDIQRFRKVTPEGVRDFAANYLKNSARVVVYGVPGEQDLGKPVPTPEKIAAGSGPESVNVDEAWRSQQPAPGAAPPLVLPAPESFQHSNGLTVFLDRREGLPIVSAGFVFRSGGGQNPIDKPGVASFTIDMLDEGTATRSPMEFAQQLKQIGASLQNGASRDSSTLTLTVSRSYLSPGLDLVADALLNPAFSEKETDRVRKIRSGELVQLNEDAGQVANRVMTMTLLGPQSAYAYPGLGTDTSLKAITSEDLRKFWAENLTPANAAIVVSGDLTRQELTTLLDKAFANWKPGGAKTAPALGAQASSSTITLVDKPGAAQTQLRVATLGPPRLNPDYERLEVMNMILGGLFSSRINLNLREKNGYSYGAYSQFSYLRTGSWFSTGSGVRTDVTAPAVREMLKEIARIGATPVTTEEMSLAKDGIIRALPAEFETSSQTVGMLANLYVYDLGLDYYRAFPGKIEAVTDAQVQEVAKKYLVPEKMVIVAVGDRKAIEPGLKGLGKKVELRDGEGKLK